MGLAEFFQGAKRSGHERHFRRFQFSVAWTRLWCQRTALPPPVLLLFTGDPASAEGCALFSGFVGCSCRGPRCSAQGRADGDH